jgi:Transposase DNA-binding
MNAWNADRSFGEVMFGNADLGDRRRTRRLVALTDQLCKHPGGSLPEKLKSPKDLKALYRLCDRDEVTHQALVQAVRPAVLAQAQQHDVVLILHDSTELDYSTHKSLTEQLGQVGRGRKRGYLCHTSLAVSAEGRDVLGVVNQVLHHRVHAPKRETLAQRRARQSRESRLWLRGTEGLPGERRFIDVADQGSDTFEFLEHEMHSGRRFVLRAHHARKVSAGHEPGATTRPLQEEARRWPALGGRSTDVAAQPRRGRRPARVARHARLLISAGALLVHPPHARHGNHGRDPLPLWVVRVWEPHPTQGAQAIEWLLLTNEPVHDLADALRVVTWYQTRWVIEEFHKALKTGCQVEALQFTDIARLEPMIAVLSTVATTLLNLRAASQRPDAYTRRATTLIDQDYVNVLSVWRFDKVKALTVHEFFYALARLGGHQNRRGDKRPGWLVLWRGWSTLQAMVNGAEASRKCG